MLLLVVPVFTEEVWTTVVVLGADKVALLVGTLFALRGAVAGTTFFITLTLLKDASCTDCSDVKVNGTEELQASALILRCVLVSTLPVGLLRPKGARISLEN